MKTKQSVLAVVFATIGAADTSTSYIIERSDLSPYLHHVNELIDNLKAPPKGENLCNPATNGCGKTVTVYSAQAVPHL